VHVEESDGCAVPVNRHVNGSFPESQNPVPLPVQQATGVPEPVQSTLLQVPVPLPVQQAIGVPAAVQLELGPGPTKW
jgi:hypothetical protein